MNHWQNKPFVKLILPFLLGIWIANFDIYMGIICLLFLSIGSTIILLKISVYSRKSSSKGVVLIITTFMIGYIITYMNDQSRHFDHYARFEDITHIQGKIKSVKSKTKFNNVVLQVSKIKICDDLWKASSGNIQLYIKSDNNVYIPSDILTIKGVPRRIEPPRNPFEFDFSEFSFRKHISHSIFVNSKQVIKEPFYHLSLRRQSYKIQLELTEILSFIISFKRELNIANALILGYKEGLDTDIKDTFQGTGAMHILAVSGLHVGIIFMLLNFILSWIPSNKPLYKILKSVLLILGIWSFAFISGLSTAVIRASFMFSMISFGQSILRPSNIYNTLAFSAFILLSIDPYLLYNVGFQLSYTALLSIVFFYPKLSIIWQPKLTLIQYLWQISIVSISAQIFTWPLITFYFHQFSLSFLLSNLIVMPFAFISLALGWVAIIVYHFSPELAIFIGQIIQGCLGLMYHMLEGLSQIDIFQIKQIFLSKWELMGWIVVSASIVLSISYQSKKMVFLIILMITSIQTNQAVRKWNNNQKTIITSYDSKYPILDIQIGSTIYQYCSPRNSKTKCKRITEGIHAFSNIELVENLKCNTPIVLEIDGIKLKMAIINQQNVVMDSLDIAFIIWNKFMILEQLLKDIDAKLLLIRITHLTNYNQLTTATILNNKEHRIVWIKNRFWSNDLQELINNK